MINNTLAHLVAASQPSSIGAYAQQQNELLGAARQREYGLIRAMDARACPKHKKLAKLFSGKLKAYLEIKLGLKDVGELGACGAMDFYSKEATK